MKSQVIEGKGKVERSSTFVFPRYLPYIAHAREYYAAVEIQPYPGETGGLPRRKLIRLSLLGNHDHLLYDYVANKSVCPYTQRETLCPRKVTIKRKARNLLTLMST